MPTRELTRPPALLGLYGRAVASLLPGASRLPMLPGRGDSMPRLTLTLEGVRIEPDVLAAYRDVCGFAPGERVPATFPHILAFPLHMALMTDPAFPFLAVGLVHVENTIVQRGPVEPGERVALEVSVTDPRPHRRGRTFEILTLARVGSELVWEERSTMLRREATAPEAAAGDARAERTGASPPTAAARRFSDGWEARADTGRRYAAVSGDRNPIHMSNLTARAFGFPRAIAHGMWSKARCLAALETQLPGDFAVSVSFRKPIALPARLSFAGSEGPKHELSFELRGTRDGELHLLGDVWQPGAEESA